MPNVIVLPRQARDEHKENSNKRTVSAGSFDGRSFTPDTTTPGATGVLVVDYGYVAAGKTGGNVANDPMGRRVFFGWNMPWSRQGSRGAEGPWRRRQLVPRAWVTR